MQASESVKIKEMVTVNRKKYDKLLFRLAELEAQKISRQEAWQQGYQQGKAAGEAKRHAEKC